MTTMKKPSAEGLREDTRKPRALKTPWGLMDFLPFDAGYVERCGHTVDFLPYEPFQWGTIEERVRRDWLCQEKVCPSCRPELYVFEEEPEALSSSAVPAVVEEMKVSGWTVEVEESKTPKAGSSSIEEKPLRFVGHLKGCWATDRYQDNEHCGCWRILSESDIDEEYTSAIVISDDDNECAVDLDIVGLPDMKLRGDYD